jgi:hypothetical protein
VPPIVRSCTGTGSGPSSVVSAAGTSRGCCCCSRCGCVAAAPKLLSPGRKPASSPLPPPSPLAEAGSCRRWRGGEVMWELSGDESDETVAARTAAGSGGRRPPGKAADADVDERGKSWPSEKRRDAAPAAARRLSGERVRAAEWMKSWVRRALSEALSRAIVASCSGGRCSTGEGTRVQASRERLSPTPCSQGHLEVDEARREDGTAAMPAAAAMRATVVEHAHVAQEAVKVHVAHAACTRGGAVKRKEEEEEQGGRVAYER